MQEEREGSLRQSELGGAESVSRVQQSLLVAQEPGLTSGGEEEESDSVAILEVGLGLRTSLRVISGS